MQILTVLLSLIPQAIQAAQAGTTAWHNFLEARKVQGNDELNANLDMLKADFVRIKVLAEYQAQPGTQA
jgi:hypothetical protein